MSGDMSRHLPSRRWLSGRLKVVLLGSAIAGSGIWALAPLDAPSVEVPALPAPALREYAEPPPLDLAAFRAPLWMVALAVSIAIPGIAAREFSRARAEADRELSRLDLVLPQVQQIALLRAKVPHWADRKIPETALAPAAAAVVASCGLPSSALANVSPEARIRIGEGQLSAMRQRATITLNAVTLPEVGRFLEAWRRAQPDWTIVSVDLSPQQRANVRPGRDLPLRAVITIEAMFMPAATRQQNPGGHP